MNAPMSPQKWIAKLMDQAFSGARDPRSPEYKEGVRCLLLQRFVSKPLACPYKAGTASYDAFFAGTNEGCGIWADHIRSMQRFG